MPSPVSIGLCLAAGTSVVNVLMDVCRKKALVRNDLISTTFWIRLFGAVVLAGAFLLRLQSSSSPLLHDGGAIFGYFGEAWPPLAKFLIYLFLDTGLVAVAVYFYFAALKESDLSVCVPFMSFTPVLLIPTGYLFLHEVPNMRQFLGVVLVVSGALAMDRQAFRRGLMGPVRAMFRNKGSRYILIVAVIFALTNPIDKVLVIMSDPITYGFGYGAMICLFYGLIMVTQERGPASQPWTDALRAAPVWVIVAGALDASVLLLQFTSHRYIDVFITITVKRAGVILSVFAGWLVFHEKNIEDRLFASITMLGGVVLIYTPLSLAAQLLIVASLLTLLVVRLRTSRANLALTPETHLLPAGEIVARDPIPDDRMAASILRCSLVGCGSITREYLAVYRDLPWVEVVSCIDIDESRASSTASYLGAAGQNRGPIRVATKIEAALTDDVDVVVISTPNHLHREHAIAALQRGKHVFLQKPIAATLEDGLAIVQEARQHSVTCGVYMSYFDQPVIQDLRGMVRSGCFGEITQMHMKLMHPGGLLWSRQADEGYPTWRGSIEETGGGAFIQLAVHCIRILSWTLDDRVTHVQGFASNRLCVGLEGEDTAVALLKFESGAYATLNISWCAGGEELAIHGSEGSVVYQDNRWVTVRSLRSYKGLSFHYEPIAEARFDCPATPLSEGLQAFNQHRLFLEAVRDRTPPFVSLEDGLRDLAVVAAFYRALRTESTVAVDLMVGELVQSD